MHDPRNPPARADGSIAFELLTANERREYLDGWGHATIKVPAVARPAGECFWFDFGRIEGKAQSFKHRDATAAAATP
jgi:hypothetical protein